MTRRPRPPGVVQLGSGKAPAGSYSALEGSRKPRTARLVLPDPIAVSAAPEPSTGVLTVAVPFPPSTNRLYANVRGRRVKTAEAKAYAEAVFLLTRAAVAAAGEVPLPPFALRLDVWVPDRRRHDLSNLVKCCEDAVFAAIGWDDCHVEQLIVERQGLDRERPRVLVTVTGRPWPAAPAAPGRCRSSTDIRGLQGQEEARDA
jgi:Holliday junction resolvase RusA-like endonuclease